MKKTFFGFMIVAMIVGIADAKTLVAYYSRTGNTATLAEMIANNTGADVYRIETVDANYYPSDYQATTQQARQEIANDTLPPIKPLPDMTEYDTVFIGTPVWWGTIASPVRTFLANVDLRGKAVIPFSTNGGGGAGTSLLDIAAKTPGSGHRDGLSVPGDDVGNASGTVAEWLTEIDILNN